MSASTEVAVIAPRNASLSEKLEYARQLAESGLLPSHYRKQPANVLYAYEYAEMLGLATLAAITGIHVIEGKPSASSALMSALVRRAGHRLRVFGDDEKAVAEITRIDDPEFTFRSEWTLKRARQAELLTKGTWKKYPAAMLKARAISECARDACEETLLGMSYTPEELGAETDEDGIPLRATASRLSSLGEPPEQPEEPNWNELIKTHEAANSIDELKNLWNLAKGIRPNDNDLFERIAQAAERVKTALTSTDTPIDAPVQDAPDENFDRAKETRHIWALLQEAGMDTSDAGRNRRLHIMTRMLNRPTPLESFNDLTDSEIASAVGFMERRRADGDLSETLAQMAPTNLPAADIPAEAGTSSSKGKAKMSAQEIDMARNEVAGAANITALGEIWNRHIEAYVIPPVLKKVFEKRGEELKRQAADALWQQVLERAPEDWTTEEIDAHFAKIVGVAPDEATAADMQHYIDAMASQSAGSDA